MNPTKNVLLTVASVVILCAVSSGYAQTLQEMEVKDLGLVPVVVRNPEVGILIVESVIPELSFESSMGIIKVTHERPGEWILHLFPGTNLITFKAEGYKSVNDMRLVVPKKRARKVEVKPLKTFGTLMAESDPPGADIFLDGEDTGERTPHRFENQATGMHRLALKRTHYLTDTTTVEIKAGETTRITRPLQAVGYLTLRTSPSEAEVVIDSGTEDVLTVTTPVKRLALKTGVYSLSVRKSGYLGLKLQGVTVEKGEIVRPENLVLQPVAPGEFVRPRPFYKQWWFWGLAVGGIGGGAYYWWSQQQVNTVGIRVRW